MIESLTGQGIDVSHACRVLGVSQSGYYEWKKRPLSPRALRRIWLAAEIADVHKASAGTYGALRVTAELRHGREIIVGHNAVESIMRELGIKGPADPPAAEGRPNGEGHLARSRSARVRSYRSRSAVDDRHRAPRGAV